MKFTCFMSPSPQQLLPGLAFASMLLGSCEQPRQAPEQATQPPTVPMTVPVPAKAKEKILTSGDTWPSTSHDTLRVLGKVVPFLPVNKRAFDKLPAFPLGRRTDTIDSPDVVQSFGPVSRQGLQLVFKPANGRQVVLTHDTTDSETVAYYHYWTELPKVRQWVVMASFFEGSAVKLIDQRTGQLTTLWGEPSVSPDGRYLLAYNTDMVAGFDPNGLQLYRMEATGPRLLWERLLDSWGPAEVRWDGNKAVVIKQDAGITHDGNAVETHYVRLDLSQVL